MLKTFAIGFFLISLLTVPRHMIAADDKHTLTLEVPGTGDVQLQVTVRDLPNGARLTLSTADGKILGAVAPFRNPGDLMTVTATVPLPRSAIVDGHAQVNFQILEPGKPARAARTEEIGTVRVVPSGTDE